jgi:hypothetical protein
VINSDQEVDQPGLTEAGLATITTIIIVTIYSKSSAGSEKIHNAEKRRVCEVVSLSTLTGSETDAFPPVI